MPTRSTATFNQPLTAYAQSIMADRLANYDLANTLCPIVPVGAAAGTFKKFDDRNAFLPPETFRGIGGPRTRLKQEASDGTYNCQPHGLEIGEDDFETPLVGENIASTAVGASLLAQGKIKSMISRKSVAYANRVVSFVASQLTAVSQRGNWTNAQIDPIDQIDEQLQTIATTVASTENIAVVMSLQDWFKLRSNPIVKKRLGIKPEISLTKEMLVGGLLFPVKLVISAAALLSSKFGQTGDFAQTKTQIMAGYCIVLYSMPNPTPEDASAFKCFSTSSVLVDAIKTYRAENANSDIHACDWSEDLKATGTACASLMAIT